MGKKEDLLNKIETSLDYCIFTNLRGGNFITTDYVDNFKLYIVKCYSGVLDIGYYSGTEWVTEFGNLSLFDEVFEVCPLTLDFNKRI